MDRIDDGALSSVLEGLSDRRRRRVLRLLQDRESPLDVAALAVHLAALERDTPRPANVPEQVESVQADLVHVQLPKLEDAGLVTWDRDAETVTTTAHPALRDPTIERILEAETDDWDAVLRALANARRRVVLAALQDRCEPVASADLAREIVAREGNEFDAAEDLYTLLAHADLPKLDEAGLIEYDRDDGTAIYVGHSTLDVDHLDDRIAVESLALARATSN